MSERYDALIRQRDELLALAEALEVLDASDLGVVSKLIVRARQLHERYVKEQR